MNDDEKDDKKKKSGYVKSGDIEVPFSDDDTSLAAAESYLPLAKGDEQKVLRIIAARGTIGATCDEVEQLLNMKHQTASARVRELTKKGWIAKSGFKRPTRSRRSAAVMVVAQKPGSTTAAVGG